MKKILMKLFKFLLKVVKVVVNYLLPLAVAIFFFILTMNSVKECIEWISVIGIVNNQITLPLGALLLNLIEIAIEAWLAFQAIECIGFKLIDIEITRK